MPQRPPVHRPDYLKIGIESRPSAAKRGYDRRWQAARAAHLKRSPWCVRCLANGVRTPARQVDHRIPHRGDPKLFWDKSLWDSLCDPCSNAKSRAEMLTTPLKG